MNRSSKIYLESEAETERLARRIAPKLVPGDVLLLEGPIGAGKTAFARSVIQARLEADNVYEDVPSPTFTLVQVYEVAGFEIWHADLYRLGGPADVIELGLDGAFDNAVCIVEWPDRLGEERPNQSIEIAFSAGSGESHRELRVSGNISRWSELLRGDNA